MAKISTTPPPSPGGRRSNGCQVVVDISRSRKGFRPMQPVEPPPKHLMVKMAYKAKLGCGAPKMLSTPVAPPAKRHRMNDASEPELAAASPP